MTIDNERLNYLFSQYYNKMASEEEKQELFLLLQTTDDRRVYELIGQAWEKQKLDNELLSPDQSRQILHRILSDTQASDRPHGVKKGIKRLWKSIAAAAAIIIFLSFGSYFLIRHSANSQLEDRKLVDVHDILPGGNKAFLTLGDGSTILLEDTSKGLIAKRGNILVNKTDDGQLVYTVQGGNYKRDIEVNKITTPRGGQYQVVLPDGSKVWLNAASSISFPTAFAGKERVVEIEGEVYFEIARDVSKPFVVKSNKANIEVLGTRFNVMAYADEDAFKTTLLEGSIKMNHGAASNLLKPGEQAVLNDGGEVHILNDVDVSEAIAWKNGLFEFKEASIESVMRQISRWYDVEVRYEGEVPQKQFNGRLPRNVKASELFDMLEYIGVKFKIEQKSVIVLAK